MSEDWRSPLAATWRPGRHGNPEVTEPGVLIEEWRPAAMVQVAAWPDSDAAVRETLDRLSADGGNRPLALAPGRYLSVGDDPALADRLQATLDVDLAAITDLSHARSAFRLTGSAARPLLQKGLAIDLDPSAFAAGAVLQSSIHHIGVIVQCAAPDTYDIYCYRGFALSLLEWLTDAAEEFGYDMPRSGF